MEKVSVDRWIDFSSLSAADGDRPSEGGGWVVWGGDTEKASADGQFTCESKNGQGVGSRWRLAEDRTIQVSFPGPGGWQVLRPWMPSDIAQMSAAMAAAWFTTWRDRRDDTVDGSVRPLTRRICVCGHSVKAHITERICNPTRIECHCTRLRPMIEVDDTRYFVFKTRGFHDHAVTLGIMRMSEKHAAKGGTRETWRWLDGQPRCDGCGKTGQSVGHFVLVDETDHRVVWDAKQANWLSKLSPAHALVDKLLCGPCVAVYDREVGRMIGYTDETMPADGSLPVDIDEWPTPGGAR